MKAERIVKKSAQLLVDVNLLNLKKIETTDYVIWWSVWKICFISDYDLKITFL